MLVKVLKKFSSNTFTQSLTINKEIPFLQHRIPQMIESEKFQEKGQNQVVCKDTWKYLPGLHKEQRRQIELLGQTSSCHTAFVIVDLTSQSGWSAGVCVGVTVPSGKKSSPILRWAYRPVTPSTSDRALPSPSLWNSGCTRNILNQLIITLSPVVHCCNCQSHNMSHWHLLIKPLQEKQTLQTGPAAPPW